DPGAQDPEQAFEKEWRNTLMSRAVERVRRRLASEGAGVKFQVFESYYLDGGPEQRQTYTAVAARLGGKEGEVKHYLVDGGEDIRNEIRAELARSLSRPEDLQEEWNAFFAT